MRYQTLIFDLDGTLSDPFVGIARSVNHAFAALGFPTVAPERVRPMIGPPLDRIFEHFLGPQPAAVMQELVDRYRERYGTEGYAENAIYADIPQVIPALAAAGYTLGICTSKRADYASKIVAMFGLAGYFSFVSGGEIGVEKARQLRQLVADGVDAATAIMIGDRDIDILAGRANAVASVGVLWGFGQRAELAGAAPDHLVESPRDLLTLFCRGTSS